MFSPTQLDPIVPSLTQKSVETATKHLFYHLGNLVNPVELPPASVSGLSTTQATEAEESTVEEDLELVVNISDQERAVPPSPAPARLESSQQLW